LRGLCLAIHDLLPTWVDPLAHTNSTVRTWAEQEMQGS
jgi:hypothetical protein